MSRSDIKIIFFDAHGVLLEQDGDPREAVAKQLQLPLEDIKAAHRRATISRTVLSWSGVDSWDKEVEYSRAAAKALLGELGLPQKPSDVEFIADQWLHRKHKLLDGVVETLDYLKAKYRLGMISNAAPSRRTRELAELDLLKYFDPIVISGEFGVRKPDPLIYVEALKLAEVDAEDAAFVDDVESFLDVARQIGFKLPVLFDHYDESSGEFTAIKHFTELKKIL